MMNLIVNSLEFLPVIHINSYFPGRFFAMNVVTPPASYQEALFFLESKVDTLAQFNP
jgi:hypothetical protein